MIYGILTSESCLFTNIVDLLHKNAQKVNSTKRLTRYLNKSVLNVALKSRLTTSHKWAPCEPVIHIDDSNAFKPDGYKFEVLGFIRDAFKITVNKSVDEKGYP